MTLLRSIGLVRIQSGAPTLSPGLQVRSLSGVLCLVANIVICVLIVETYKKELIIMLRKINLSKVRLFDGSLMYYYQQIGVK